MAAPTREQLNALSEAAKVAAQIGDAYEKMESLGRKYQLLPYLSAIADVDLTTEAAGIFRGFDKSQLATFLRGLAAMRAVAEADGNAMMKATYALADRHQ